MNLTEGITLRDTTTLAQRLATGRLTVAESLRYATQLGEVLQSLHDGGGWHGALSPSNIGLYTAGVELLAPPEGARGMVTAYTAPEVVEGGLANSCSDIFSFGTILYEMLTGRRAFDGDSRASLAAQITKAPAPASGSPAVDRLVGLCLAKSPGARAPEIQKVMLELKRLAATLNGSPVPVRSSPAGWNDDSAGSAIQSGIDRSFEILNARVASLERIVEAMRRKAVQFEHNTAADLVDLEHGLRLQSVAIESARTAMSQTDDLVERVVEALESLQTSVLDHVERPVERAVFAVN